MFINVKCMYIANFRKKIERRKDSLITEINVY